MESRGPDWQSSSTQHIAPFVQQTPVHSVATQIVSGDHPMYLEERQLQSHIGLILSVGNAEGSELGHVGVSANAFSRCRSKADRSVAFSLAAPSPQLQCTCIHRHTRGQGAESAEDGSHSSQPVQDMQWSLSNTGEAIARGSDLFCSALSAFQIPGTGGALQTREIRDLPCQIQCKRQALTFQPVV